MLIEKKVKGVRWRLNQELNLWISEKGDFYDVEKERQVRATGLINRLMFARGKKKIQKKADRLVFEAFEDEKPSDYRSKRGLIKHIDGDVKNNDFKNLKYISAEPKQCSFQNKTLTGKYTLFKLNHDGVEEVASGNVPNDFEDFSEIVKKILKLGLVNRAVADKKHGYSLFLKTNF